MKLILEARDQFAVIRFASGSYRGFVERECQLRWQAKSNWEVDKNAPPLSAWIYRANWVATCDVCREQLVIDFGEVFFCPSCLNLSHGGKARVVLFPKSKDREQIEALLVRRPNPNNRNWLPHETVENIRDENVVHGHDVGD